MKYILRTSIVLPTFPTCPTSIVKKLNNRELINTKMLDIKIKMLEIDRLMLETRKNVGDVGLIGAEIPMRK